MAEFNEHDGRGGRERGRGGRDMRRPNRDEQREERRREAARHTGLMKAAFGRETDEAIENARIYEEGEGRSLLWGAEAAAAAEAAKRAAEMAEADADGAQAGNVEAREVAEIAEEDAEAAEAEEAMVSDGAAGAATPQATETTVKVVTSFAPEALYRDATGKTMIADPGAFTRPGGAYEDGAFGPEQILCSESNLYPILVAHKRDFYDKNRDYRRGSLFTDRALYVPEVLFSRGGDVRRADVLVIAEPVRAFALENHRSERECDKALADRIEAIFRIAAANGTETLIVGAFGCGRNGYPVEQVIELIQNWIAEHPGAVPNVVFAVPRMHADAFREAFGAPEPGRPAPVVVAEGENDREGDDEDWRNVELPEGVTLR